MSEWKEYKLEELVSFRTGKLNSNAAVKGGTYPFFTCSPETLAIDNYSFDCEVLLLAGNNADGNFPLKYYKGKFNAYQRTYLIELLDKNRTTYKYLYYNLLTQLKELKNISGGSATKFLTLPILNGIKILAPDFSEQQQIASVLSSLDDKIDLLHRQNKILEQLAETLFRQWFIEEEYGESNLEDWILFDPREKLDRNKLYQVFSMNCLSNTDMSIKEGTIREVSSATIFKNGDTLLAKITPCLENGKTGFVMNLEENEIAKGSTEFIVMRTKGEVSPYWIYCLARSKDFHDTAILSMTGTSGRQRVQVDLLRSYQVKINLVKMKIFNDTVKPNFHKINSNTNQIRTLTQLRDTLLPKLMSGEVRIV